MNKNYPKLNIKDLALLKSNPKKYYKKQLHETEKYSPQHIQELPYDRNTITEGKLNHHIDKLEN